MSLLMRQIQRAAVIGQTHDKSLITHGGPVLEEVSLSPCATALRSLGVNKSSEPDGIFARLL